MSDALNESADTAPWDRLARILATADGWEAAMLLGQAGLLRSESRAAPAPKKPWPVPIGPWMPREGPDGVEFVRTGHWDKYLWLEERDVLRARKAEGVCRVCLVGESVAAGMFFAPAVTPAKVLNSILNQAKPSGIREVEVIDLSRNAMRLGTLVELADAAGQLAPDALVVFAGNNFGRDHTVGRPELRMPPGDYVRAAVEGGPVGLTREFTRKLAEAVRAAIDSLAQSAARNGTPLVWLLPANCSSWQRLGPVPLLGGGATARWHRLFRQARSSLEHGRFAEALELGRTMAELDRGACQTSQRVLATALAGLGRRREAAEHCQREVDVDLAIQRPAFLAPGCQASVRDAIFEGAVRHRFHPVDLADVFAEHTGSRYLDERLFVDYCHLSVEGMQVAMTAAATAIARFTRGAAPDYQGTRFEAAPGCVARGLFEAAVYTSHMQQTFRFPSDLSALRRRFGAALTVAPEIAQVLKHYVRFRHGAVVTELSDDAHRLVAGANSLLDFGILQWIHGVDAQTIEAICGALDDAGHNGAELLKGYQEYDRRRLRAGFDVSEPRHLKYYGRDGKVDWDPERGTRRTQPFLRSHWPELPLVFAADAGTDIDCQLTVRLPGYDGQARCGPVRVVINGHPVATFPASERWTQERFRIDGSFVNGEFNDLVIEWPDLAEDDDADIRAAVRRYQSLGHADWFAVFGEVFSFRIQEAQG